MQIHIGLHTVTSFGQLYRISQFCRTFVIRCRHFYHRDAVHRVSIRQIRHRSRNKCFALRHFRHFDDRIGEIRKVCGIRCNNMRNGIYGHTLQTIPVMRVVAVIGIYVCRLVTHRNTVGVVSERDEGGYGVREMLTVRQQPHAIACAGHILHVRPQGSSSVRQFRYSDRNIILQTTAIGC